MNRNKSIKIATFCLSLLLAGSLQLNAQNVTFNEGSVPLKKAFEKIESVSEYKIAYNDTHLDVTKKVVLNQQDKDVLDILSELLKDTGYTFKQSGNYLVIIPDVRQQTQKKKNVTGVIKDEAGLPVIGANVVEKGTTNGTITGVEGNFSIEITNGAILLVSYIGYDKQEVQTTE